MTNKIAKRYVNKMVRMRTLHEMTTVTSGFKIYNASAGSGKTYQLTKTYLSLLLEQGVTFRLKQLLALTFTNKAVAEMKQRILDNLFEFSKANTKERSLLFHELAADLQYTPEQLQSKAKTTLKLLLHNYSFFEISTIDKFNHKLIRTFAQDLKLTQNFEVELDSDLLLNQAVNRVLNRAGDTKELTKVLIDFALEKIENYKSWNIAYDLTEIGKIVFQESHKQHLAALSDKSIADFNELKKVMKTHMLQVQQLMVGFAKKNLELITANNLEPTDFLRSSFPKFMQQIADNNMGINFTAQWKNDFENTNLYTKSAPDDIKTTIDALHDEFARNFRLIKENFIDHTFLRKAYNNVLSLTLINEIQFELKKLQQEENLLSISEFNTIIANEIKNQPVPFIYERLGEKYRYYFIDEFQDTSTKQWENLIPLIGNALEGEDNQKQQGTLLLVGDVKQSIYRWRGGEASQFLELSKGKSNPFVVSPVTFELNKNWRSHSEIIEFNNSFFTFIAEKLSNSEFRELYQKDNQQLTNSKKGGLVEVNFLEEEATTEDHPHCQQTLKYIHTILDNGYSVDDICILVRDNKNALLMADFLTRNEIPVVSSEALLLKNSPEVDFLVNILYYITEQQHSSFGFAILEYLQRGKAIDHDSIQHNLQDVQGHLKNHYGFDIAAMKWLGVFDIIELAIEKFKLGEKSNAFINFFLDTVFDHIKKLGASTKSFLNFWEIKRDKLSITAPEAIQAVKLMTIHKSKGLEFPFVIFPFADTVINDSRKSNKIWVPINKEKFAGFSKVLLQASEDISTYSDTASTVYELEKHKSELDDFNVLYVAMTRAVNGLFVIADQTKNTTFSYAGLLKDFLINKKASKPDQTLFQIGGIPPVKEGKAPTTEEGRIPYIYTSKTLEGFQNIPTASGFQEIESPEALRIGNLLHKALAEIITKDDIENSINTLRENEKLTEGETLFFEHQIRSIISHPNLQRYYEDNVLVWNEVDILAPNGKVFRPDRVIFEGSKTYILDYKTGIEDPHHKTQLGGYADILSQMGYHVEKSILVYSNEQINTIVV